jgi:hypothetical protein
LLPRCLPVVLIAFATFAQEPAQPPVRVNVLNVCTPSTDEQKILRGVLGRIPARPIFATDFELTRGRSTMAEGISNWVRVRREFPAKEPWSNTQYSLSVDPGGVVETLVFRMRDPADIVQIALEAHVTSGNAAAVLASDTPAEHMRLERLGKPAVVLARCPTADQKAYEPLFAQASAIFAGYRRAVGARTTFPGELAKLGVGVAAKSSPAPKKAAR